MNIVQALVQDINYPLEPRKKALRFSQNDNPVSGLRIRFTNSACPKQLEVYTFLQSGNNRMGIQAASTYLRFNPKDEQMHDNMKYYSGLPELQDIVVDDIESLAPIEHHELYEMGRKAYNAKNYSKTVEYFEASIKEYIRAYEECKTLCEVKVEGRQQYIRGGIYGYHMQLLLCTLDCPRKLSMLLNYPQPGYLSKQFDFLHYSYTQRKYSSASSQRVPGSNAFHVPRIQRAPESNVSQDPTCPRIQRIPGSNALQDPTCPRIQHVPGSNAQSMKIFCQDLFT
jgi:hypothetical protein